MTEDTTAAASRSEQPASAYSWYVLGVLVVVYILNFIDRQILSILAVDIKRDLELTDGQLGFLGGAAFAVFYALFGVPLGRLADRWHRVRLLTIGLVLWSTMTALSGLARNYLTLSLARMGVGVGEATASPTAYSLISDYFPSRQRATALAIYSSGLYLGGGVSLLIGAKISQLWDAAYPGGGLAGLVGWQAAFIAVGVPGLLLAVWVASLREPVRAPDPGRTGGRHPLADFFVDLSMLLPPLTFYHAMRRGPKALIVNIAMAAAMTALALVMIELTGNLPQWSAIAFGYYAVFSWAATLRRHDPATFSLIWGTPAFICTALGYGLVSLGAYALAFWAAPYAETVLALPKAELALVLGGNGAVSGFLGVILGGRMSDWLRARNPSGRILVIMFGILAPVIPIWVGFTTESALVFYLMNFLAGMFAATALGAAAATTQDLVLPHMRGTATASFFLATTLVGLGLGPYMVGQISELSGSMRTGVLSLIGVAPISLALLIWAYRALPQAEATMAERAAAASAA
ncbi:spinster family MFS transporter [Porphyrobacter sp. CACIAM 03H1]|uniref:spinster family MFS transporter n=1 Tax=Porphyrobacter sp. CACIAM 03H1 TaxID=2003315 RepID=UPI000B5A9805|nr:MFS transporter [Porphyrobacter sp. CACIAM 03H1]ASJ89652.1 MFS transporter [Porphyrobacter sp. CACIAM 03H1]